MEVLGGFGLPWGVQKMDGTAYSEGTFRDISGDL